MFVPADKNDIFIYILGLEWTFVKKMTGKNFDEHKLVMGWLLLNTSGIIHPLTHLLCGLKKTHTEETSWPSWLSGSVQLPFHQKLCVYNCQARLHVTDTNSAEAYGCHIHHSLKKTSKTLIVVYSDGTNNNQRRILGEKGKSWSFILWYNSFAILQGLWDFL